jgi:hypothetical protein
MPEICRFFGIVITMNHSDHVPPHFHARYQSSSASIAIASLTILKGRLPPRVLGLTLEWAMRHRAELLENWERAQKHAPLLRIEPLQ